MYKHTTYVYNLYNCKRDWGTLGQREQWDLNVGRIIGTQLLGFFAYVFQTKYISSYDSYDLLIFATKMCSTLIDVLMYANTYHNRHSFACYAVQMRRLYNHGGAELS